ncbi:unnamed protein product (macronuclear) [Paramecium tetraurelia]|uniref:Uncharacterized protein n=1 Tax=Paramecium tetraurelia TaxID=5888 RepID=A0EAD0_PARTE|nr:uncharacterized protein GSPATT00024979001 [Paramecium tetraurelia]CAK92247.1 unnamed protein product [Paramecium tetraurelia]|eukprot:XP_001459644.1 hypothetical protein (macronuclear) [Paramecium tetraurelia strain d4-2]
MSNNTNNDLADQNTSQQSFSPQPLETSKGIAENTNQYKYSTDFQDPYVKGLFFKNLYCCLIGQFLYNLLMIILTFSAGMINWLVTEDDCNQRSSREEENCVVTPKWLFYFSLVVSIILSFTIYFGGSAVRKGPIKILIQIFYPIFYGFTFSSIFAFMIYNMHPLGIWETLSSMFLILIFLNIAYCGKREVSCLCKTIIIIVPPILLSVFFLSFKAVLYGIFLEGTIISMFYGFYLILEASLILKSRRLNLQPEDYQIASLLLNGLLVQPLVRVADIILSIVM